jgi:TatD DNase family protein
MIDSHAHLHLDAFEADREEIFRRLRETGVSRVLEVGIDLAGARASLDLAGRFPELRVAVGCHPHEAASWNADWAEELRRRAEEPAVLAWGEIGLDFFRDYAPRDSQERAFREQLRLARELELPVVFHVRAAEKDFLRILDEEGNPPRAVLHAFSHDGEFAARCLERGFWLGIGGIVTFPKSSLPKILEDVPPERVLMETDCPWLAPVPLRGKRNEPAYLAHVLARLSRIWGIEAKELEAILDGNFHAFAGNP